MSFALKMDRWFRVNDPPLSPKLNAFYGQPTTKREPLRPFLFLTHSLRTASTNQKQRKGQE